MTAPPATPVKVTWWKAGGVVASEALVTAPTSVGVPVDGPRPVAVSVEGEGLWCGLDLDQNPGGGSCRLQALAALDAPWPYPPSRPAAETPIRIRFSSEVRPGDEGSRLRFALACRQEQARLRCPLPVGRRDAAIELPGGALVLVPAAEATAARPLVVPTLRLVRSAQLRGAVTGMARQEVGVTVAVTILDRGTRPVDRRVEIAESTADLDSGAFRLGALPAGPAMVRLATGSGLSRELPVAFTHGETIDLGAIELLPEVALAVSVNPPVSPSGEPWVVWLSQERTELGVTRMAVVERSTADAAGNWKSSPQPAAVYEVGIFDKQGFPWWRQREVDLREQTLVTVALRLVPIRGRVVIGERPVAAQVLFGSRPGDASRALPRADACAVKVLFDAKEREGFTGFLPHAGRWSVSVRWPQEASRDEAEGPPAKSVPRLEPTFLSVDPVEVEASSDHEPQEIVVRAPDTRVVGRVVDRSGQPTFAMVQIDRVDERGGRQQVRTRQNGTFEILGLRPGRISLYAEAWDGSASRRRELTLEPEREILNVELVLDPRGEFHGQVFQDGAPVPGATVVVRWETPGPGGLPGADLCQATTDATGRFECVVGARRIALVVSAPGRPLALRSIDVSEAGRREQRIDLSSAAGSLRVALDPRPCGGLMPPCPEFVLAVPGAEVNLLRLEGQGVVEDTLDATGAGELLVRSLEAGRYTVCVVGEDGPSSCQEVLVSAGDATRVQVQEPRDAESTPRRR
ncbi:MAG: carboxypeptidase regulatory-like domain-containing protein [Holophagales bacterium]|nr:MAG: carboxypeptidase regulatory-like domain-containing protein [Holophagales bacterium]